MFPKILAILLLLAAANPSPEDLNPAELIMFTDDEAGFSISYPEHWTAETDVDRILYIQDGPIDLIHEEQLTEEERETYRVLIHIAQDEYYLSNVAALVYPHLPDGSEAYDDSESALAAVLDEFELGRASGTFFLMETYLGESHTHVYRRNVPVEVWDDQIRITYYITASRTRAYMLVETVLTGSMNYESQSNFNQVIQSFRAHDNEIGDDGTALDWGLFKPGEETEDIENDAELGRITIREDFGNNARGWPIKEDSLIRDGCYILDSRDGYPFTVRNTSLGQIAFDFSYEGEVKFEDGDVTAGYGLVFGYLDGDNYFAFLITHGGGFMVIEERNGVVEQLIPGTPWRYLDGDSHTLMVQGNYMTVADTDLMHFYDLVFYIDGRQVGNVRTDRYLDVSGWFGVFVSRDLHVSFDWLESRNYLVTPALKSEPEESEESEKPDENDEPEEIDENNEESG